MLPQGSVDEVIRLLALGTLSQKKIADVTRVSRGSVSAIAAGKRRIKSRRLVAGGENRTDEEENWGFRYPTGPWKRCPICGAFVRTPCLACQLERTAVRESVSNSCQPERSGVQ